MLAHMKRVLDFSAAMGLSGVESVGVVLFVAESTLKFSMRTIGTMQESKYTYFSQA